MMIQMLVRKTDDVDDLAEGNGDVQFVDGDDDDDDDDDDEEEEKHKDDNDSNYDDTSHNESVAAPCCCRYVPCVTDPQQ